MNNPDAIYTIFSVEENEKVELQCIYRDLGDTLSLMDDLRDAGFNNVFYKESYDA